ncbi:TonB-dependent receptor [alpha proteobacterium AAP81b]|nr:TonB-dependent receptor [alpha proteobacterium AAP81b]
MTAVPALAQPATAAAVEDTNAIEEIVVTAQRTAQSLQDVPVAVSAFTAEALQKQQINNASDLQLSLPNITFTKGNFTGSSFTIRGIGDLCVGGTCDSATAIHTNDLPLFGTRLFETEYFDLERVEVLRGPQGTLFGRNATSGVINFVTAKPTFDKIHAAGEIDYGNYDSIRGKAMFNLPITDTLAVRVAGTYLNRDGYTFNLFNNTRIDGRNLYALRGSVRWQPTDNTTVDAMVYYFKEDDDRLRIQKQLCQRDPTGVLGCLPGRRDFGVTNANSTFVGTLSSREFLTINGGAALGAALGSLGLGSLYGPDAYANNVNPADPRVVNTDNVPTYKTDELQAMLRIEHDFGPIKVRGSGLYQRNGVDSSQDYNLSVQNAAIYIPGLTALNNFANGLAGPALAQFRPVRDALTPNGPNGPYCTSLAEESGVGAFGGRSVCAATPLDFDRSNYRSEAYTGELIVQSQFDGKFNFLLGGIYNSISSTNVDYYVNAFGIDYVAGVLGVATSLGQQAGNPAFPNSYLGTPFFRNNQQDYNLSSYGIFGEAYYNLTDRLKVTIGLRYNNDKKFVRARSTLASFLVPFGSTSAFGSPFVGSFDADPGRAGNQLFQERNVGFQALTGRAVVDWKITDDNLLYFSYSRGYKSGGVNPPLQPVFNVGDGFSPEFIDAFEIGSKNTFLDGTLRLNVTAFYYNYSGLQLSRIVARTSVNDNVDARVYGLEIDGIMQPTRNFAVNFGASYLKTEVIQDKFLANPRDPSGGRSDAVIIKDITNGSNCAIVSNTGNATAVNTYVGAVNGGLGLRAPTAFPSDSGLNGATGAFSICGALAATAANPPAALRTLFATPTGALPFTVLNEGVTTNIKGNQLPQAPTFKANFGVQYTFETNNGWSIVPRFDLTYTGASFGNIFNGSINRIPDYFIMNAQVQVNGKDDRWYVRGYIQNIANNNAVTGLYVTDQSSGLFTNIFTLEPQRYGIAAGFRF